MQLSERDVTKGLETTVFSSKPSETDCKLRCRKMFVHMSLEKSFSGRKQIFLQKGVNSNSQWNNFSGVFFKRIEFVLISKSRKWLDVICCDSNRCRSMQIFGGAIDFCPNFPNVARKTFGPLFVRRFSHVDRIGRHFLKSKNIGRHFLHIKRRWAQFLLVFSRSLARFSGILRRFSQILPRFPRIFRDFARILTKSNILGVHLLPLHPCLLHHWWFIACGRENVDPSTFASRITVGLHDLVPSLGFCFW